MQGVLLLQLGTPDAPTARALRPYLRDFLWDPRVIDAPRWKWWLILNLFILPFRPRASAAKYRRIWDPQTGSPLLHLSRRQAALLEAALPGVLVRLGMRPGRPSTAEALDELIAAGVDRIAVVPLFPQYSATSTASALDGFFDALRDRRAIPPFRIVWPFPTDPGYIDAIAAVTHASEVTDDPPPEKILISFHGIPVAYTRKGDPYREQCVLTADALAARMGWPDELWQIAFQSRFGREEWLQPYLEETLVELARAGTKRVMVITPGFVTDCLETIDEIGYEADEAFREAGGERLIRVPCLNDAPEWIDALAALVRAELAEPALVQTP